MSVNNWLATWQAADCAAREAMGTIALQARLARDRMGEAPSEAELLQASGMREVADALLRQATIAMRRSSAVVLTSPRLGYDEMWDLALHAGSRMQADFAHT